MKKKTKTEANTLEFLGLESPPLCYCGNNRRWFRDGKETPYGGYRDYCCMDCMRSSPKTIAKRKATMIERFGVDSYAKIQVFEKEWSEEKKKQYNERMKETCLERYGVDHHTKTKDYLNKREKTWLEKYGVKNALELVTSETRKSFFASEEGKRWNREESKGREFLAKHRDEKLLAKVKDPELVRILRNKEKDEFCDYIHKIASGIIEPTRYKIAKQLQLSTCHVNLLFRGFGLQEYYRSPIGRSAGETDLAEFIDSLGLEVQRSNRTILSGFEIDIVIPSKKIGIEYNGIYYHSEDSWGKDRDYHLRKTERAEAKGYQLLQVYDIEWLDPVKRLIWESIIKAKCGLIEEKIYARDCTKRKISPKEAREFLDENHLEGFIGAKEHYGLFFKDFLVSVISFGQSRFCKNEYEVIRFASLLDTLVVGGYSKLLKCFEGELVSFANRRFSSLLMPNKFMELDSISGASWKGYSRKDYELKHRLSFTKQKLKKLFDYDESLTAFENMTNNGYDRIWDSGHIKYRRPKEKGQGIIPSP